MEGGQSISQLVNAEMKEELIKKGHSRNVAEKSLLFTSTSNSITDNASVESASAWIDTHKYDADFEEELLLQGQAF